MTIDDLRAFIAVYNTKNVSNAAVSLQMTQSALSKRLKNIQVEVHATLISTTNRRQLQITESGEAFYRSAQRLIDQYDHMAAEIATVEALAHGSLRLGSVPVVAQFGLISAISTFMMAHPNVNVHLEETEGQRIVSKLQAQQLDAIIVRDLNTRYLRTEGLTKTTLLTDELMVVLPATHPLAQRSTIALSDLQNEAFTTLPLGSGVYETLFELCHEAGFDPHIRFESTHIETILAMVTSANQVSLLFRQSLAPLMTDQLVARPLTTPFFSRLQFIYANNAQTPAITQLLTALQQAIG
ncbi:LysR family transcriptional regulator [Furfurilactobacillus entadae]|uniref:LysR family transcriptional regulator n=1 Tax=Furfurilactobacillus entadae TaxID=2922307 RepID=UPI0035EE96F6